MSRARRVHFSAADNSYVHNQGTEGTCYAHAVATLVVDALRSLSVPGSVISRDEILSSLIRRFGRDGANPKAALSWAIRTYVNGHSDDAETLELETQDAVMEAIEREERKVMMCFYLAESQMELLQKFFDEQPSGILSRADLGEPHGPIQGHAVVIESAQDYDNGGGAHVPAHLLWRFKNSWGAAHADAGFCHVARTALPQVHFYMVEMTVQRCRFYDLFPESTVADQKLDLRNLVTISSRQIASGSFGSVFKGELTPLPTGRPWPTWGLRERAPRLAATCSRQVDSGLAVKCASRANRVSQLLTEMRHLLFLKHEHIVELLGFTVDQNGRWALVMPRYTRGTLSSLSTPRALPRVLLDVASALAYVHEQGYIHCDVKESNILLHETIGWSLSHPAEDGERRVLRGILADFGSIQRVASPQKDPRAGSTECGVELLSSCCLSSCWLFYHP